MNMRNIFALGFLAASFGFAQGVFAQDATLFLTPANTSIGKGETIWLSVVVDTGEEKVNAITVNLSYPDDQLEALGVSTSDSVITLFAEKEASDGRVKISGATPGTTGVQIIASIGFEARTDEGSGSLIFLSDSAVLRSSDKKNIVNLSTSAEHVIAFTQATTQKEERPSPDIEPREEAFIYSAGIDVVSPSSILVSFETREPVLSRVEYGMVRSDLITILQGSPRKQHEVVLADLVAQAVYVIHIVANDDNGAEVGRQTFEIDLSDITDRPIEEVEVLNEEEQDTDSPSIIEETSQDESVQDSQGILAMVPGGIITILLVLVFVFGAGFFLFLKMRR